MPGKAKQRKNPKQKRSRQTVNYILEAAARAVSKYQIDKISTSTVSKLAGVSPGSFYQYFENKEALLVSLAERITRKSNERVLQILEETKGQDLDVRLAAVIDFLSDNFVNNQDYLIQLYKIVVSLNQLDFVFESRRQVTLTVAKILREEFHVAEPACYPKAYVMVQAFVGVIHSYLLSGEDEVTIDEIKSEFTGIFKSIVMNSANH